MLVKQTRHREASPARPHSPVDSEAVVLRMKKRLSEARKAGRCGISRDLPRDRKLSQDTNVLSHACRTRTGGVETSGGSRVLSHQWLLFVFLQQGD